MNKHLIVALGTFALVMFTFRGSVQAAWYIDRTGTLIQVDGMVLGDDTFSTADVEDYDVMTESKNTSTRSIVQDGKAVQGEDGQIPTFENLDKNSEKKLLDLKKRQEAAKKKLELETKAREKNQATLKQKTKSKLEIENGRIKVKQETESENGKVVRQSETEIEEGEDLNVEQEDGKILELKAKEGKLELKREQSHAKTDLPISIGAGNELIVTRPDGTEKVVTILPDQATEKMRERGLSVDEDEVELEDNGEETVYKFQAQQNKKLLGLFNWSVRKETKVSAETGEEVSSETLGSAWTKLLDRLSL